MAELKKVLSYKAILLITINSIMGTGVFFLPAVGAGKAGPASIVSWLIMSFIAIYTSMCFAELVSMFPKAGGVYEFCKHAYGRFFSFIIGWITIIAGNVTIAMLIVGAIQYLLPYDVGVIKVLLSLGLIFVFNYIAYRGMQTSAVMLIAFALITLGSVFAIIIPNLINMEPAKLTPFFVMPMSAIFVTVFFIAETFFGWETATFLSEETKDGQKVMPKALIISTCVIAVICLVLVVSSLGVIPWEVFGKSLTPFSDLAVANYGIAGKELFTLLIYLSIIGSVAGWIVAAPRLLLAMAQDRLFLTQLAHIHPKYNTPGNAIIFQTMLTSILIFAGSGNYTSLVELLVPLVLIMYGFVVLSVTILRYKKPEVKRYYTAPFGKLGPILLALFMMFLIFMWIKEAHGAYRVFNLALSFVGVGIPIYFLLEMYYNPKTIRRTSDFFSKLAYLTENITLPKHVQRRILLLLGNVHDKKVLEYGCGVGTLTGELAEEVGKKGKVFAVDISAYDIKIAKKRAEKRGHNHVVHIHDPMHAERVHPDVPKVDAIVSAGALSYLKDSTTVLRHMNGLLKKGGRVVFLDYDKFFDLIPNTEWLENDEEVVSEFKKNGFEVDIIKSQGVAWKYLFIFGVKVSNVNGKKKR